MKKFLRILLYVILVLFLVVLIVPVVFKGKIIDTVQTEINKSVKAKVEIQNFRLTLLRNFPNLTLGLKGLTVTGIDAFEKDTIVQFKSFDLEIGFIGYLTGKGISVRSIVLDNPKMYAHIREDGSANWDIAYETEEEIEVEVEEETPSGEPADIQVSLKSFKIKDMYLTYADDSSEMYSKLSDLDFTLSGDFSMDFSSLDLSLGIADIFLRMDGINYAKNISLGFNAIVDADLKNSIYTIKKNELALNDLLFGAQGRVEMPNEDINMDLSFTTNKASFKSLLSLVPAFYLKDFETLKTEGQLQITGSAKGVLSNHTLPDAEINLKVENAMLAYPDLPKSVDNINIDIHVFNNGLNDSLSEVNINQFHFEVAQNPFDLRMNIKAPAVDPLIDGKFTADLDLASLADAFPLEDMSVSGKIKADVNLNGAVSSLENEAFEEFDANGFIELSNLKYTSVDLPNDVNIQTSRFEFSPQSLNLSSFLMNTGNTDLSLNGKIENYLPYVLSDGTLKGELMVMSNLIDANEFLEDEAEVDEDKLEMDTTAGELFIVPSNVDFTLKTSLQKIMYEDLVIDNFEGLVRVYNSKVHMENVSMNMLDGSVRMTGEYNTQDTLRPFADFNFDADNINIPKAYLAFNTIQKVAPVAKNSSGFVSVDLDFYSLMDDEMSPVLSSV
ncbi:AsmA family protein, partial [Bacteroidota bacterium]